MITHAIHDARLCVKYFSASDMLISSSMLSACPWICCIRSTVPAGTKTEASMVMNHLKNQCRLSGCLIKIAQTTTEIVLNGRETKLSPKDETSHLVTKELVGIMHLSILGPTTPHTGHRWAGGGRTCPFLLSQQ